MRFETEWCRLCVWVQNVHFSILHIGYYSKCAFSKCALQSVRQVDARSSSSAFVKPILRAFAPLVLWMHSQFILGVTRRFYAITPPWYLLQQTTWPEAIQLILERHKTKGKNILRLLTLFAWPCKMLLHTLLEGSNEDVRCTRRYNAILV